MDILIKKDPMELVLKSFPKYTKFQMKK